MKVLGLDIKRSRPKRRAYEAADKSRRGKAFRMAGSTGANREIAGALVTLRDRSRHLVRNNGWSKRAIEAIARHTIGEGIQPAPVGDLMQIRHIKDIWHDWAESTACDWYGKMNFYGLQELAMRAIAEGGDVLIVRKWVMPDEDCAIPVKLQVLEGDQIDHTRNGINEQGIVRLGVQYNTEGQILGYWIYDYHPGDGVFFGTKCESQYVDKADVIHAFEVLRPGQCRGVPFGVAAFMKTGDFSDYEDAQLVKQKIAACFAAFVLGSEDTDTEPYENLEPGIIEHLNDVEKVEFANPPAVGDYDPYSSRILQGIAAAYGITYEMLTMDYSRVNFTSGRMAKIDVTANFRSWQYNMIVPQLCEPVWKWFLKACMIAGKVKQPIRADWTAPRVQQLDPTKETDAQVKRIKSGLTTISEVIREIGREPDEFFKEYQQDVQRLREMGITVDSLNNEIVKSDTEAVAKEPTEPAKAQSGGGVKDSNTENMGTDNSIPALEYGVGGTQSMVDIITNDNLSDAQKTNILIEWFGLDANKAKKMLERI